MSSKVGLRAVLRLTVLLGSVAGLTLVAPAYGTSEATWSRPIEVDPVSGPPSALSCVSPTACVVGDVNGAVLTGSGKDWSKPHFIDRGHALVALSCSSLTFCAAFDDLGRVLSYDGATWSPPVKVSGAVGVVDLSCTSATFCLAVTGTSRLVFSYDGNGWTNAGSIPDTASNYVSVSCAAGPMCAVGDRHSRVVTGSGASWTAWHVLPSGGGDPTDVSCPSSSVCVAVAGSDAARFEGGAWTDTTVGSSLHALSCPTPTFCIALQQAYNMEVYQFGQWNPGRPPLRGDAAIGLSCSTETSCLFLNVTGRAFTWNGTGWTKKYDIEQQPKPFSDLSCPRAGFCALTDGIGQVMMLRHGAWTAPTGLYDIVYSPHVSCVSAALCFLMDNYLGQMYRWSDHCWCQRFENPLRESPRALSCSTSKVCLEVAREAAAFFDGSTWVKVSPPAGSESPTAAACASPTFCMAAYDNGEAYIFDGSSFGPGSVVAKGQSVQALSCASPQLCLAVLSDGTISRYDGTDWAAPVSVIPGGARSVSCPTVNFCATVGPSGQEAEFDGSSWSAPVLVDRKGGDGWISCSSADFCVAADSAGFVVTKS